MGNFVWFNLIASLPRVVMNISLDSVCDDYNTVSQFQAQNKDTINSSKCSRPLNNIVLFNVILFNIILL